MRSHYSPTSVSLVILPFFLSTTAPEKKNLMCLNGALLYFLPYQVSCLHQIYIGLQKSQSAKDWRTNMFQVFFSTADSWELKTFDFVRIFQLGSKGRTWILWHKHRPQLRFLIAFAQIDTTGSLLAVLRLWDKPESLSLSILNILDWIVLCCVGLSVQF